MRPILYPQDRAATLFRFLGETDGIHQRCNYTAPNRYPKLFSFCRDFFKNRNELRILSYGCSTGEEVETLRQYFPQAFILGVDINPWNLKHCRKKNMGNDVSFCLPDEVSLHKPFDLVFCLAVLRNGVLEDAAIGDAAQLYPFPKFDSKLQELDSFLKPGGLLCLAHVQYRFADSSMFGSYRNMDIGFTPHFVNTLFNRDGTRISPDEPTIQVWRKNGNLA